MDQARKEKTRLSVQQQNVLDAVVEYINTKGYPPSIRDIGRAVGLASPSTVFAHLMTLERAGYIRRGSHLTRAIEVLPDPTTGEDPTRPLVAWVSPSGEEGDIETSLPIPSTLFGPGNRPGVIVNDRRLIGEHILPGDLLVLSPDLPLPIDRICDETLVMATFNGAGNLIGRLRRNGTAQVSLFVGDNEIASGSPSDVTVTALVAGVLRQTAET